MRVLVLAVALSCVGVTPALADVTIYAGPPNQYFNADVSADQGEKVTFQNLDLVEHDVVAKGKGPDGLPLFKSELVARGGSSVVAGTEYLTSGPYDYFCSIHPNMTGVLTITGEGQPKPRPGAGPPPSNDPPPQSPAPPTPDDSGQAGDREKPTVSVRLADKRLRVVRKRRAVRVKVTTDETITLGLTIKSGKRTLGGTTVRVPAGTRTVTVKLKRFAKKVSVIAQAADAAGNGSSAQTRATLR